MSDRKIEIRPAKPGGLHVDEDKHELVIGGSNMNTLIYLTDAELAELRRAVAAYPGE
jgi:hypothetical protein